MAYYRHIRYRHCPKLTAPLPPGPQIHTCTTCDVRFHTRALLIAQFYPESDPHARSLLDKGLLWQVDKSWIKTIDLIAHTFATKVNSRMAEWQRRLGMVKDLTKFVSEVRLPTNVS